VISRKVLIPFDMGAAPIIFIHLIFVYLRWTTGIPLALQDWIFILSHILLLVAPHVSIRMSKHLGPAARIGSWSSQTPWLVHVLSTV
jgi:hypothetical protein